ncbi:anion transporter [Singulisphaera acidiphila]|uniref:Na+/H+ antiporter NhaD-like permease n=1 Tax=Singulisphaera acidiphila (strain ATCC BAA-1392 / DSM 18658 / VKM B-2454 / MOB10) TaxID=886293 RepID=L0DD09_SINAD|nr:Na+/H+ antiporter NhaD-like permease [Singulisphaera acidiphila DSM 18658]
MRIESLARSIGMVDNVEEGLLVTMQTASIPVVSTLFGLTYLALALGKIPGLRIDRAGIALVGAAAMLACGAISMPDAAKAVDYETIVLLFGMMVIVASLRMAGFFALATEWIDARFSGPFALLAVTIALSGLLSAFLVNDVVCVALTPLVLQLCQRLKRPPIPYLIGLATASNVGSVATITGNPQNIIIGSLSQISYLRFAVRLAPVAAIGLILNFVVVAWVYRKVLRESKDCPVMVDETPRLRIHRPLLIKGIVVTTMTVAFFFAGKPIPLVALVAAAVLMLDRIRPEKLYRAIDWPLLVMFTGLFVVVHAFEVNVVHTWGIEGWNALRHSPVVLVSGLSVILSNLVSNVPAVLLFKPLMEVMPQKELAWLALAMSSTLAGNLTLLGSVANLIVVENARRAGTELGFVEYLKVGVPLTIVTTLVGVAWLRFINY